MSAETGLVLRLGGFMIEAICAIALMKVRGQGKTVAGLPAEYPLIAGLAVGFVAWAAGLIASRWHRRRARDE